MAWQSAKQEDNAKNELIGKQAKQIKAYKETILKRLKEQYKKSIDKQNRSFQIATMFDSVDYDAMRLFCLDCSLLSLNDIESMENEINEKFNK